MEFTSGSMRARTTAQTLAPPSARCQSSELAPIARHEIADVPGWPEVSSDFFASVTQPFHSSNQLRRGIMIQRSNNEVENGFNGSGGSIPRRNGARAGFCFGPRGGGGDPLEENFLSRVDAPRFRAH